MIWDEVRGQDIAIDLLRRSVQRGRLAHGYAFHGPPGVGRRLVARKLAQALFCEQVPDDDLDACGRCPSCKQIAAGSHPDLLEVGLPPGKKTIPLDALVGEKEKRGREGLCYELAMRPLAAPRRVAIIDDADLLAVEGANALLKTLEEPPAGAILILIAESPESLLPTIRSRCQPLHFVPLPDPVLVDLLVEQGEDATAAESIAPLAGGSLQTARQLLDPELRALRETVRAGIAATPLNAIALSTATQKAVEAMGSDNAAQRRLAQLMLRFVIDLLREAVRSVAAGGGSIEARRLVDSMPDDPEERLDLLGRMSDRVVTAESSIAMMSPIWMVLDGLFDDLAALRRGVVREMFELPPA